MSGLTIAQHERSEHWHFRTQLFIQEADTIRTGKIVFLGNSITEGFDLEKYFSQTRPVNRGISGDHIDGLLERYDYSVLKLLPSKLYILIGINDIGAGDADSLILVNYKKLMTKIAATLPEKTVFIQSILPTTSEWSNCPVAQIQRLNRTIRDYSLHFGFNWINLYDKFVTEDHYLNPSLTSDGLHLNERGYDLWASILNEHGLK